jgi:hypothetical protein
MAHDYSSILLDHLPARCISLACHCQIEGWFGDTYSLHTKRKASNGRSRSGLGDGYRRSRDGNALAVAERSTTRGTTALLSESQTREDHGEDNESELLEEHGDGCVQVG